MAWQTWEHTDISDLGSAGEPIKRDQYTVSYQWLAQKSQSELEYVHEPLLVRNGDPAHNGYFHRLDFTYSRQSDRFGMSVIAGVHGSSNMFNHANFHDDALVITGRAYYDFDYCDCQVGISGDYRFGHFRLYPTIARQWHWPKNYLVTTLTFPVELGIRHNENSWSLGVERYGNKWGALDKDREIKSEYFLEEWQLLAKKRLLKGFYQTDVYVQFGYSFDTTIRYLDLLTGKQQQKLEPAWFIGFTINRNQ